MASYLGENVEVMQYSGRDIYGDKVMEVAFIGESWTFFAEVARLRPLTSRARDLLRLAKAAR